VRRKERSGALCDDPKEGTQFRQGDYLREVLVGCLIDLAEDVVPPRRRYLRLAVVVTNGSAEPSLRWSKNRANGLPDQRGATQRYLTGLYGGRCTEESRLPSFTGEFMRARRHHGVVKVTDGRRNESRGEHILSLI
jgi:hypothetical protein